LATARHSPTNGRTGAGPAVARRRPFLLRPKIVPSKSKTRWLRCVVSGLGGRRSGRSRRSWRCRFAECWSRYRRNRSVTLIALDRARPIRQTSDSSGAATCAPPTTTGRSQSSHQPEAGKRLPTNLSVTSYTTSRDLTPVICLALGFWSLTRYKVTPSAARRRSDALAHLCRRDLHAAHRQTAVRS
jgi:hypothetical protein